VEDHLGGDAVERQHTSPGVRVVVRGFPSSGGAGAQPPVPDRCDVGEELLVIGK
jgi:hypothetical protein